MINEEILKKYQNTNLGVDELKEALKDKQKKEQINQILDKIMADEKLAPKEEFKSIETPDFNYNTIQKQAQLYGVPPRDFEAFIPLLRILHLEDYDKNDYSKFNLIESIKVLQKFSNFVQ